MCVKSFSNPVCMNGVFLLVGFNKLGIIHCTYDIKKSKAINKIVFISLKIISTIANSVDPDVMPHYAAFHLGLNCLPKYAFRHQ